MLVGLTGQVSFGHVGFYAIGAYAVAILTAAAKVSFWLALPIAARARCAHGAVLALPALRVRGPYLAMVTIAFGFIVEHGAVEWSGLTGGQNGIMGIPTGGRIRVRVRRARGGATVDRRRGGALVRILAAGAKRLGRGDARGEGLGDRRGVDRA